MQNKISFKTRRKSENETPDDRIINARLAEHIRNNAIRPAMPDNRAVKPRLLARLAMLPLYILGLMVFTVAVLFSYLSGALERRWKLPLWDRLGLPVAAAGAGSTRADEAGDDGRNRKF